ncbi:flagellar basal body-associated FliL family protein [Hyphomicrobium sp. 99]|uniref:flagellar basal body-associated FliL family protein n=1 Tax=Hyphomicrobium sp. 99 TaxID=1163419 RepID=UPI001FD97B0F|nr:flagellar basal body-associated FliL family protein [Hyphomicrobium sp. 99]
MATEKNENSGGTAELVKSALAAAIVGAAGGGAFGYFVMPSGASTIAAAAATHMEEKPAPTPGRFPNDALAVEITSIIADLETQPRMRVRLDISIIVANGTPETTTLKNEVKEDVIAYLKGLNVSDIQGVRGFQNLREQLDDRARVRGRGAILGLLIGGLVLE